MQENGECPVAKIASIIINNVSLFHSIQSETEKKQLQV